MSARIVQVTNVSSSVLKDQLRSLFATLGRIEEIQLYPESETLASTVSSKVGYIRFERSESAQAALNLTSTIFLDRPIICCLVKSSSSSSSSSSTRIPDEISALKFCPPINSNINLIPGGVSWPYTIINRIVTVPGVGSNPSSSYIETIDPSLSSRSLPTYPTLPGTMDQAKAEEIRRTLFVSNLDPRITFENLHDLFNQVGEIRFIRMTTSINGIDYENLGMPNGLILPDGVTEESLAKDSLGAYIEFTEQPSIVKALCLNGLSFASRHIKVNHANCSIVMPSITDFQITLEEVRKQSKSKSSKSKTSMSTSKESNRHESSHATSRSSRHQASGSRHAKRHGSASGSSSPSEVDDDEDQDDDENEEEEEEEEEESEDDSDSSKSDGSDSLSSPPPKLKRSRSTSKSKASSKRHLSKSPHSKSSSKRDERSNREREKEKEREKREKERDKEKEKERIKKNYYSMLKEMKHLHRHSSWTETKKILDSDSRFKALESSSKREEYFRDYCKSLERQSTNGTESSKISHKHKEESSSKEKSKSESKADSSSSKTSKSTSSSSKKEKDSHRSEKEKESSSKAGEDSENEEQILPSKRSHSKSEKHSKEKSSSGKHSHRSPSSKDRKKSSKSETSEKTSKENSKSSSSSNRHHHSSSSSKSENHSKSSKKSGPTRDYDQEERENESLIDTVNEEKNGKNSPSDERSKNEKSSNDSNSSVSSESGNEEESENDDKTNKMET